MSITDHADYLLSFFASIFPLQASRRGQRWSEVSRSSWNQKAVLLLKYTAFFLGSVLVSVWLFWFTCRTLAAATRGGKDGNWKKKHTRS